MHSSPVPVTECVCIGEARYIVQHYWHGSNPPGRSVSLRPPMAGDIVVMQNTGTHVHGHIQMYNGEGWVSDFVQSDFWPYSASRPTYQIFR